MPAGQRRGRWSGVPLGDRPNLRRDELIAAGVDVLGAQSGLPLTVRAVCRGAGLTERYFYESFADRDEFVRAVYDHVCSAAMGALTSSITPRDAVELFVGLVVDAPARGRVLLIAPEREPVLTRLGAEWMPSFIDLIQHELTQISDPAIQAMTATALVGALTTLFTAYLNGRPAISREAFIDYCVDLLARMSKL